MRALPAMPPTTNGEIKMTTIQKEHRGFTIKLNDRMKFEIVAASDDLKEAFCSKYGNESFDSYEEATSKIDNAIAMRERQKKTVAKTSIPALNREGEAVTLRGISGTNSEILTTPASSGEVYPALNWIAALAQERAAIRARMEEISKTLRPFEISRSRGYGRLSAQVYDQAMTNLVDEIGKKTEAATAAAPKAAAA